MGVVKMDSEATIGFAAEQYVQFPGAGQGCHLARIQLGLFA